MEQVTIWSELQLNELIQSPHPQIQSWAVARLFTLYPVAAAARTLTFLEQGSQPVVLAVLGELGKSVRPECLSALQKLYLEGSPEVSAQALNVLATWRVAEAVEWVRDKVFSGAGFSSKQIMAMIRLLGLIPGEQAYRLLKGTEDSIQNERSWKWQIFYAALLRHGKSEDLETLLALLTRREESDEHRMAALGLLLTQVDPTMNPTDVHYGNHPAVRRHLLGRLEHLDTATRDTDRPVSQDPLFQELARAVGALKPEGGEAQLTDLQRFVSHLAPSSPASAEFFSCCLRALGERSVETEARFPIQVLGLSALLRSLSDRYLSAPAQDAPWERHVEHILRRMGEWEGHEPEWQTAMESAPRDALIDRLIQCIASDPGSWRAVHATTMLGELKAVDAAATILETLQKDRSQHYRETASEALKQMGAPILPALLARLDSPDASIRELALELLGFIPTAAVVDALAQRMTALLEAHRPATLAACEAIGALPFFDLLEREYRSGEWDIARTCAHIARLHGFTTPSLSAMERDLKEADRYEAETRANLELPDTLRLELLCNGCGKRYHYRVSEVHLHPPGETAKGGETEDMTPYRHGFVIADEIHCKNCRSLNDFSLTRTTLAQLSSHAMMMQAMGRTGREIPRNNPLKLVRVPDKDGRERSLVEIELEHLETVQRHPGRPESHLALGKFYEYVRQYPRAREEYLLALDMDSWALEAMAGLARLYHAEGKIHDAYSWIDQCYAGLAKGRIYLAEDKTALKATVREKRREYAREAGIRPEEDAVEIRFRVESSDYPKNRPCPCGSGKKYKLCCMKRETS